MRNRRLLALAVAMALALLLPHLALAADGPDVSGTVTMDGAPAPDVTVSVLIEGSDMVRSAITDAEGAWAVTTGVAVGQTVTISATSPVTKTGPDAHGCVTSTSHSGRAQVAVDALPLAPITLALDTPVTSRVCTAPHAPQPAPTLPATDGPPPGSAGGGGALPLGIALVGLTLLLAVRPRLRQPRRRA